MVLPAASATSITTARVLSPEMLSITLPHASGFGVVCVLAPSGHLHIVLRDCGPGESRAQAHDVLMNEEVAAPGHTLPEDAKRRNHIRRQVLSNFISVNVWLMPPPVELTSATTKFGAHGGSLPRFAVCLCMCVGGGTSRLARVSLQSGMGVGCPSTLTAQFNVQHRPRHPLIPSACFLCGCRLGTRCHCRLSRRCQSNARDDRSPAGNSDEILWPGWFVSTRLKCGWPWVPRVPSTTPSTHSPTPPPHGMPMPSSATTAVDVLCGVHADDDRGPPQHLPPHHC
jgi:hypothetical protein